VLGMWTGGVLVGQRISMGLSRSDMIKVTSRQIEIDFGEADEVLQCPAASVPSTVLSCFETSIRKT
jgi:hypothetical protein